MAANGGRYTITGWDFHNSRNYVWMTDIFFFFKVMTLSVLFARCKSKAELSFKFLFLNFCSTFGEDTVNMFFFFPDVGRGVRGPRVKSHGLLLLITVIKLLLLSTNWTWGSLKTLNSHLNCRIQILMNSVSLFAQLLQRHSAYKQKKCSKYTV